MTSVKPADPLSASLGSVVPVSRQKANMEPFNRTNTISNTLLQGLDKIHSVRGSVMNAAPFAGFTSRHLNSQIVPESASEKRSRESSVSRATAVNEFILFLKIMDEVAIHHITLYFININTLAVILKMEKSFAKYYASSQRKLYLRGLLTLIGFMVSTFAYDYVVLWEDYPVGSNETKDGVLNTKFPKFTIVVVLKLAIVLPLLLLTFFRARKHPYHKDVKLTWLCIVVVACYPVVYNKLTNDYGVSWVCLVIMYVYSCTPIRFFPCSIFCLGYLATYVVVMLAQSREFAIRVSFMSELMVLLQQEQLKMEETRSKALLNSMLPESIVVQLQCGRELIADEYAEATVLFAEVCDFDLFSSKLQPQQVVDLLNILFYKFDKLVDVHHVHKVETIGAVYMVVGGCPDVIPNHAELVANLALDMIRCIPEVSSKIARKPWGHMVTNLNIRVGINTGGLMAGVVGIRNPRFKLFGDTVNVASRMETTNLPGQIQITEATNNAIYHKFHTALRGKVLVKGRGDMNTYFLRGKDGYIIPPASIDMESNGDSDSGKKETFNATIMTLPKGLTRTEVLFRVHGNRCFRTLTKDAYEFEESYRAENRARWLRFLRLSVSVFLVLKPCLTLYQTIRLSTTRSFEASQLIFTVNFCVMYPVMLGFVLHSFSPNFSTWEQLGSVFVISVTAIVLCTESLATNSLGHAYMSALALYQCYFANVSFLLRVVNGFEILTLYLVTNLLIAPYFGWEVGATQLRVVRNALYIFLFFAGQAWVVFNSEFKQRINHYRDITLNSQKQKLVEEEARITKLLLNLLPETIVHKLKEDPQMTIADFFDNVTVLFTDMVNFTAYSSKVSAMELVQFLNDMYTRFDTIAEREVLYKVEIIGDAYFVVGGCPIVNTNNALAVVTAATDMFAALPLLRRNCGVPDLNIRIGVHSGPVLAGVVGSKDPRYHLFGDTVSIAHFLESSGVPGRIHISESTWASMNKETPGHGFKVEYHTLLSVNGSSKKLRTYFVL
ncbi:hypothetical protein BBO99_00004964 [Phytophthora kernoviae]|uniref:adenylate cyclase n=1 Tax=Phytophthora kernoviae TaxID=325452 RepID=A0A3R7J886_9STRA|nr:hypothetical protein JM16_005964 [Phytophthora kernoviae]RLN37467.1 hypothetical protein BBI17_006209 [Phytophthora kernoviae]RLN79854.1 hypothetical protein BBO99_00004964 [Phytophthora kernoviae]